MFADLLLPMFDDEYYPDILVAEVKQHIERFAKKVAKKADISEQVIYQFAQETVADINEMKPQFEDLDSSLDDTAADYIAEAMMMVVQEQGYMDIEMEELVSNREW
jgi:predicted nucleic acid-binding protein